MFFMPTSMPYTVKVVGVSGSGKSTLVKKVIARNQTCCAMSYGLFLKKYGADADKRWREELDKADRLVIIDDHLEWGERDFISLYREEKTAAILMLFLSPEKLAFQISTDTSRRRAIDMKTLLKEQDIVHERARYITKALRIPLHVLRDATIEEACAMLERVVKEVQVLPRNQVFA